MQAGAAWLALFLLALLLIIAGFQGSLGKLLAVVFTPGILVDSTQTVNIFTIKPTTGSTGA